VKIQNCPLSRAVLSTNNLVCYNLLGEEDCVNHVDDTIAGDYVGDDYFGVVDVDFAIFHCDGHVLSKHSFSFCECDYVGCHDLASYYVVEQDID